MGEGKRHPVSNASCWSFSGRKIIFIGSFPANEKGVQDAEQKHRLLKQRPIDSMTMDNDSASLMSDKVSWIALLRRVPTIVTRNLSRNAFLLDSRL